MYCLRSFSCRTSHYALRVRQLEKALERETLTAQEKTGETLVIKHLRIYHWRQSVLSSWALKASTEYWKGKYVYSLFAGYHY